MEQKTKIYGQVARLIAELPAMTKDGKNPHFKSEYITFDEIMAKVKPIAAKYDLFVMHSVENEIMDGGIIKVSVTPMIYNADGESFAGGTMCNIIPNNVQQIGCVTTYLKRYSIAAMLGIAADVDDDGEANREFVEGKGVVKEAISNYKAPQAPSRIPTGRAVIKSAQINEIKALIKEQGLNRESFAEATERILGRACEDLSTINDIEANALIKGLKAQSQPQPQQEEITPPDPFA